MASLSSRAGIVSIRGPPHDGRVAELTAGAMNERGGAEHTQLLVRVGRSGVNRILDTLLVADNVERLPLVALTRDVAVVRKVTRGRFVLVGRHVCVEVEVANQSEVARMRWMMRVNPGGSPSVCVLVSMCILMVCTRAAEPYIPHLSPRKPRPQHRSALQLHHQHRCFLDTRALRGGLVYRGATCHRQRCQHDAMRVYGAPDDSLPHPNETQRDGGMDHDLAIKSSRLTVEVPFPTSTPQPPSAHT